MQIPHDVADMSVAETTRNDIPLRLARINFTGDTSYEISVPVPRGPNLHAALNTARDAVDRHCIGLEAVSLLRTEKGSSPSAKTPMASPRPTIWAGAARALRAQTRTSANGRFSH